MSSQTDYTPEEYADLSKFERLCAALALVEERGVHGAYATLLSLDEEIQPPPRDPEAVQRYALLSHIGRLTVECRVGFDQLGQLGFDGTSTPRTSTPYLTSDELPHPRLSDESFSYRRSPSPLRPRDSPRSHRPQGSSSSHHLHPSPRSSPPSRRSHSSQLSHSRPSTEPLRPPPGSSTFGEIRPLRLSASAEPLRQRRPSSSLSRSNLRIRTDTQSQLESPRPSPLRSFHINCSRTVLATYAERPRSLNSENSFAASSIGARRNISRPFPLRPMPLSPGGPLSPTDIEVPKVNSYPKRGIGRKIKGIASKLSLRSIK